MPDDEGWNAATRVSAMILATAQSQLAAQLQAADNLDAKAVGLLSFDGILLGLVGFLQKSLTATWWMPAVLLLISAGSCTVVLVSRQFNVGPEPREFYGAVEGLTETEVNAAMMEAVVEAMNANDVRLRLKEWMFGVGTAALFLALIAGVYWFVRAG